MVAKSLAKLPFLLVSAYCDHIILTPPNPPPPAEEQRKYGERLKAFAERGPLTISQAMPLWKYLAYLLKILEVVIMFSSIVGREGWVSFLIDGHAASKIRVTYPFIVGFTIKVVGALLRYDAYRQLGPNYTFELSIKKDHKLATSGAYSIIRHPGYSGALFVFIGTAICDMASGSYAAESHMWWKPFGRVYGIVFLALPLFMFLGGFPRLWREDEVLHAVFKEQWEAWARKTRYRLIPFVY